MGHSLILAIVAVIQQPGMLPEASIGFDPIDLNTRLDNHLCVDPPVRLGNESSIGRQKSDVDPNFGHVEDVGPREV